MIEAISTWLKQIIIITLIAAFLDLLLPSSVMQKYVRMVMGLIVVLTMISPLLSVFHSGIDPVDAILQSVTATGAAMPTTADITAKANQLKQDQQKETLLAWRVHLITLLKDQIRRMYDVQAQNIVIAASSDPNGTPIVTRVDIRLTDATASTGPASDMKPLAPITIDPIGKIGDKSAANASADTKLTASEQAIKAKVQSTVADELNINMSTVHVQFSNETGQN